MRHQTFTTFTLLLLLIAGCGQQASRAAQPLRSATRAAAPVPAPACEPGTFRRLGSAMLAFVAVVRSHATVTRRPGGPVLARFGRMNQNRVRNVFSIRGARLDAACRRELYLVQIPRRPNGVTGWVPARQVGVAAVRTRIVVDLSRKRVTLFRSGKRVLSST